MTFHIPRHSTHRKGGPHTTPRALPFLGYYHAKQNNNHGVAMYVKNLLMLFFLLAPSLAFSSSDVSTCLPDGVCVADDVFSVKKTWIEARFENPFQKDSYFTIAKMGQKALAITMKEGGNDKVVAPRGVLFRFLPYVDEGVFDRTALNLFKQIKYSCRPIELTGWYKSKAGHPTKVVSVLRTAEDKKRQMLRVAYLQRYFEGQPEALEEQLVQQYPGLARIGDITEFKRYEESELASLAEAKRQEYLALERQIAELQGDLSQDTNALSQKMDAVDKEHERLEMEASRVRFLPQDEIPGYLMATTEENAIFYTDQINDVSVLLLKGNIPGVNADEYHACEAKKRSTIE